MFSLSSLPIKSTDQTLSGKQNKLDDLQNTFFLCFVIEKSANFLTFFLVFFISCALTNQ